MKTVYRYVLMEMLPAFSLSVSVLTLLLLLNRATFLLDLVVNKNVSPWDTLLLFLCLLPFILSITVPMSMMLTTLLAFGRMSSDMEVTAFKSSGIHLFRLIAPPLLFSFLLTGVMLVFNGWVVPQANGAFKRMNFKILRDQAGIAIREKTFIDKFEGHTFYVDHEEKDSSFSDVRVTERWSPETSVQTTLAKDGSLETNQKTYEVFFRLNDGVMSWANRNFHTFNRLHFDRYAIRLKLENQLARMTDVKKEFEEMSLPELSREMGAEADPTRRNSMANEFQKRLALPFASLVLTWFCAPLGLWVRSKGFIAFVLGIVMIFIYYLMFTLGQVLSSQGTVPPILGLWWSNGILTLAGSYLYYLVISERSFFRSSLGSLVGGPRRAGGNP
jgi:lipopolysaccharide export system permease protein